MKSINKLRRIILREVIDVMFFHQNFTYYQCVIVLYWLFNMWVKKHNLNIKMLGLVFFKSRTELF